jgi:hypothetical protein
MPYQQKRTIVSILSGLLVLVTYCIYTYSKLQSGFIAADDMKFWAGTMLIFIGIGIVATIIIQIVFHILLSIVIAIRQQIANGRCDNGEIEKSIESEMIVDEMDKLIELKSMRIGLIIAGVGFVAGLVTLVLNYSPAVMLNIMFMSFYVGSLLEGLAQLYFYRRGVTHG